MGAKKYAYVNYKMLVWARSETPFGTTSDVANHISGFRSEVIDKGERGEELPSITEAKKLANLYKVPFATFYLSNPPEKKTKAYTDRRTYNDTVYRETSYELWSEIGRITGNRQIIVNLSDDTEYRSLPSVGPKLSEKQIADVIRKYFELDLPFKNKSAYRNNGFNYYRALLEHYGIMVAQITGVSLSEMRGISMYYDTFPIIAINNKDFERAKVFSLFHEVAHLVRRSSSLCLIDFDERNDEEEKICDRIAAEVLMPEESFRYVSSNALNLYGDWSDLCLISIADKYAVSTFSVVRRLRELDIINGSDYYSIYKRISDSFKEEQDSIIQNKKDREFKVKYYITYLSKEGYLFPKKVLSAYSRGDISYGEMCSTLSIKGKHICYRNTPWALTLAHSLGFGIYRPEGLVQLFSDTDLWTDIGYKVISGTLENGKHVKLMRSEEASPTYFKDLLDKDDAVLVERFDNCIQEYKWVSEQIKKNIEEDELDPDDILVIFPDTYYAKSEYAEFRKFLILNGINSNLVGVATSRDTFKTEGCITCSHIYRAKGNEAPMVYILNADYCAQNIELRKVRNILFTAITRSRAWVRICGVGDGIDILLNETKHCSLAYSRGVSSANRYRYTISFGSSKITEELHSLQQITRIAFSPVLMIMESVADSYIPNWKSRLLFMAVFLPQIFCTIQQVNNSY